MTTKFYIKKIPGVRGFVGTTYAVMAENGYCHKIFLTKKEAEAFIKTVSE